MSERIGNRPPAGAPENARTGADVSVSAPQKRAAEGAGVQAGGPASHDSFEKFSYAVRNLQTQLQPSGEQKAAGEAKNVARAALTADSEELLKIFSGLLAASAGLDRRKRAALFAKAIFKKKGSRLSALFADLNPAQQEDMCEAIGDILDGSPKYAGLVDKVTEGSGKAHG